MKKLIYPIWQIFKAVVVQPYYRIRSNYKVWELSNLSSRRLQHKEPIALDEVQKDILGQIKKDGIYVTHLDDLFPGQNVLAELQAYAKKCEVDIGNTSSKSYFWDYWDLNRFVVDFQNPFLRLMLDNKLLGIANAYFDMYTRVHSVRLVKTLPVPPGSDYEGSQSWHRDGGNKKYLKIFIYLNDVLDEGHGPFHYIKESQPGARWYNTFPQPAARSGEESRITDEALDKAIPKEYEVSCMGRAGSVVFADTTGLHKGGYATTGERIMSFFTYFTKSSLTPLSKSRKFIYPENFDSEIAKLSPQAKFAISRSSVSAHPDN